MSNRLANATSPYLLQHRENPVDWWEWGDEPFAEARERDVPVLLSIGYAACHWCHVMARESFEDPDTAALMNRLFVNVKVDREERPDVDSIYMEAVQTMTGRGGWPMTVWLDHQGRPFYAGTYYPKEPQPGMPAFREVVTAVSSAWHVKRDDVTEQSERLVAAISRSIPATDVPEEEVLQRAWEQIASTFDPVHGGFGSAPKFPQQPLLEFLLRVREEPWADTADLILSKTLDRMARGGIHDQLGGGFARYSVDDRWLVPHFEKMLYDNAQLARIYLWAGIELERADFVAVARGTLDYLMRDLRQRDGGLFSSEDADSEGVEGKFYVWTAAEIRAALGTDADVFTKAYGVTESGNFEGSNILHRVADSPFELTDARSSLLAIRSERVRPGLDDKVIASWNGLAIRALAEAGAALGDTAYLDAASQAASFVMEGLVVDGRLMRSWRNGRTSVPGFLEDHAAMAVGLFSLYSATGEVHWYSEAMRLVETFVHFSSPDGGFFSTRDDAQALIKRPTDRTDNPHPSGNALAAEALLTASLFTGDADMRVRAASALAAVGLFAERYPSMVGRHLAVAHSMGKARELAIAGEGWQELAGVYWQRFRPNIALAVSSDPNDNVPLLNGRYRDGESLAYLCAGFVCDLPVSSPAKLADQLS